MTEREKAIEAFRMYVTAGSVEIATLLVDALLAAALEYERAQNFRPPTDVPH